MLVLANKELAATTEAVGWSVPERPAGIDVAGYLPRAEGRVQTVNGGCEGEARVAHVEQEISRRARFCQGRHAAQELDAKSDSGKQPSKAARSCPAGMRKRCEILRTDHQYNKQHKTGIPGERYPDLLREPRLIAPGSKTHAT